VYGNGRKIRFQVALVLREAVKFLIKLYRLIVQIGYFCFSLTIELNVEDLE